jgi:Flp pilus assembly protein TadG
VTNPDVPMRKTDRNRAERGQIIVIFALGLVALVSVVGLVLDGGSTFAQRRSQQNATDLAALTGANIYMLTGNQAEATIAARGTAAANGFTNGAGSTSVTVSYDLADGADVSVAISAPHRNTFTGVVGITEWTVSTDATAEAGIPNGATGAAPWIFSIDAFNPDGTPLAAYGNPDAPFSFNLDNSDVPTSPGDVAWTDFHYDADCADHDNVDASTVKDIIDGSLVINTTVNYGCYIGQHNNGEMTTVYGLINTVMVGQVYSVPVVDDGGNFQGWAAFRVTGASGGSVKTLQGYFESPFLGDSLVVGCPNGNCPRYLGQFILHLID